MRRMQTNLMDLVIEKLDPTQSHNASSRYRKASS